jgi:hypothetical protein
VYLKAKEELWKLTQLEFHHAKIYNFPQKNPLKEIPLKSFRILL